MPEVFQKLEREYHNIARLLDLLDEQTEVLSRGESPNFPLMSDIMHYMMVYPDVMNHPREHLILWKLVEKDCASAELIGEFFEEHERVAYMGKKFASLLSGIVNGAITPRDKVITESRDYIALMRSHMHKEEAEIFPKVRQTLHEEDWTEIDAAMKLVDDPLFGEAADQSYLEIYKSIKRELDL